MLLNKWGSEFESFRRDILTQQWEAGVKIEGPEKLNIHL